jgi:hypothetical protein
MSDPQIVYYRYRYPKGWLTKGNPFGFEVYQPTLDGFPEPDPNPIEELYYVYGKWVLRSRGKGRRQEFNVLSQDHAKLWVEKYGDSNCVNSCKDAAFEKAVLKTFKTKNRAFISDHSEQKQKGFFYPREWTVLFVSKSQTNTHLETKSFLFEHSDNLGLCAYVSPFLRIDRRYTEKKIIASKSVFEITRLDTASMDEFLKSRQIKLPFPLKDRVRKTALSDPEEFNQGLSLEDRLQELGRMAEEAAIRSRKNLPIAIANYEFPQDTKLPGKPKQRTKQAIQKEKDYIYLLQEYEGWVEEKRRNEKRKRFNPKDWLSDFNRWKTKARNLFDQYSDRGPDKPLNQGDEESIVSIIGYARKIRTRSEKRDS